MSWKNEEEIGRLLALLRRGEIRLPDCAHAVQEQINGINAEYAGLKKTHGTLLMAMEFNRLQRDHMHEVLAHVNTLAGLIYEFYADGEIPVAVSELRLLLLQFYDDEKRLYGPDQAQGQLPEAQPCDDPQAGERTPSVAVKNAACAVDAAGHGDAHGAAGQGAEAQVRGPAESGVRPL